MHQISVSDILIDIVRKDIKNLHLGVYPPTGRVRVAAPLRVDDEAVRLFAVSRLPWIKKQKRKFESQARETERQYVSGESHYFEGNRYLLNLVEHNAPPLIRIRNKKYIDLCMRPNSSTEQREAVMIRWYRETLKDRLPALTGKWEAEIGVSAESWEIKKMKTKWGTCNAEAKRIWINLELAKKPTHCLEYIIVHELVHLRERNHTDRFVELMDSYLPQWRLCQAELNRFILSHSEWID